MSPWLFGDAGCRFTFHEYTSQNVPSPAGGLCPPSHHNVTRVTASIPGYAFNLMGGQVGVTRITKRYDLSHGTLVESSERTKVVED